MPIPVDPNATEEFTLDSDLALPEPLRARFSLAYPREAARRTIEKAVYGESNISGKPLQVARLVIGETLRGWEWPIPPEGWQDQEELPEDIQYVAFDTDRKTRQISDDCYKLLRAQDKLELMKRALEMMGLRLEDQD